MFLSRLPSVRAYPKQLRSIIHGKTNDAFLRQFEDNAKAKLIGCSYSPELVERITHNSHTTDAQIISFLTQELMIRDVRVGIRWNRVEQRAGRFDFSYYDRLLTTLLSRNAIVCLNVGPIKTFQWPEVHVPSYILDRMVQHQVVENGSFVSEMAMEYLDRLLEYIQRNYPVIRVFQPENEPFHIFGKPPLKLDAKYLERVCDRIYARIPGARIILNSSEARNIPSIFRLMKSLHDDARVTVGINYYYRRPARLSSYLAFPDSITQDQLLHHRYDQIRMWAEKGANRGVEITEFQMERWGAIRTPGMRVEEFRYGLLRVADHILPHKHSVVRVWGVEYFIHQVLQNGPQEGQQDIIDLIRRINCI